MMPPFAALSGPRFEDERGWLQVLYESEAMVLKRSFSRTNVFRGLHVQTAPSPQRKLIRVIEGRIVDILVPLDDTGTILSRELGPEDGWIGIEATYAHGFYAREDTLFEYVCEGGYDEAAERAFSILPWLAGTLGVTDPIISAKDRAAQPLRLAA